MSVAVVGHGGTLGQASKSFPPMFFIGFVVGVVVSVILGAVAWIGSRSEVNAATISAVAATAAVMVAVMTIVTQRK